MNIFANTTKEQFESLLREFPGIRIVTVFINSTAEPDGRTDPNYQNSLCSPHGNIITIYFNQTSFPTYEGDVPTIYLNPVNDDANHRTGISQGRYLWTISYGSYSTSSINANWFENTKELKMKVHENIPQFSSF